MQKVYTAEHPADAHLVRGLLESEGIVAEVHGEDLFNSRGRVPMTPDTLPTVWVVEDSQTDDARRVIEAQATASATAASTPRSWTCGVCHEAVEAQFDTCWNCGADRPVAAP